MVKKQVKTSKKSTTPKKPMSDRLASLKEKLLLERERLFQEMKDKHNVQEISAHGDLVDQSNDYSEREILLGLAEHDRTRLLSINDALGKIEEGTYGICATCGNEIPEARLIAIPTAKYCIKCQSRAESRI